MLIIAYILNSVIKNTKEEMLVLLNNGKKRVYIMGTWHERIQFSRNEPELKLSYYLLWSWTLWLVH